MNFNHTEHSMMERLQKIFREVLDNERLRITAETTQTHVPEWDSLAQVALIMAIEKEFQLSFTARETSSMVSVRAIADLIQTKSAQAPGAVSRP
jgi:acyl carrier protein